MHIPKALKSRFDKIFLLINLVTIFFDMWPNHLCHNIEELSFTISYFILILTFKTGKNYSKEESKFILYNLLHNILMPIKIKFFINLKLEFIEVNKKSSKSSFDKEIKFLDTEEI